MPNEVIAVIVFAIWLFGALICLMEEEDLPSAATWVFWVPVSCVKAIKRKWAE